MTSGVTLLRSYGRVSNITSRTLNLKPRTLIMCIITTAVAKDGTVDLYVDPQILNPKPLNPKLPVVTHCITLLTQDVTSRRNSLQLRASGLY